MKEYIECECCGFTTEYQGGCFRCPQCGVKECNPYVVKK